MPLFLRELNALADRIKRSALTCYLHTAAPSDADTDNGRVTTGGGAFASGKAVPAGANITRDADGDLTVVGDIDFGTATADVGAVVGWSLFRGSDAVAYGTLPSTTINSGDTFKINGSTLQIAGTTS